MTLFFSAQQLSPKYLGCLTRREQYFTDAAATAKCPSVSEWHRRERTAARLRPHSTGTCRSSVTACPSTAQQLHRAVHKHRGRIKGGGTGRSSIKDNNWFSVSQLPPTAFTRWPRCCGRRASALLQRLISGVKSGADAFVVAANRRPCPSPLATLSRLVVVVLGPCNIRVTFGVM